MYLLLRGLPFCLFVCAASAQYAPSPYAGSWFGGYVQHNDPLHPELDRVGFWQWTVDTAGLLTYASLTTTSGPEPLSTKLLSSSVTGYPRFGGIAADGSFGIQDSDNCTWKLNFSAGFGTPSVSGSQTCSGLTANVYGTLLPSQQPAASRYAGTWRGTTASPYAGIWAGTGYGPLIDTPLNNGVPDTSKSWTSGATFNWVSVIDNDGTVMPAPYYATVGTNTPITVIASDLPTTSSPPLSTIQQGSFSGTQQRSDSSGTSSCSLKATIDGSFLMKGTWTCSSIYSGPYPSASTGSGTFTGTRIGASTALAAPQPYYGPQAVTGADGYVLTYRNDGTVWGLGHDDLGQLGDGNPYKSFGALTSLGLASTAAVQAQGLTGVIAIAAGNDHAVALKADGTVWAWGWSKFGQIGTGDPCTTNSAPYGRNTSGFGVGSDSDGSYVCPFPQQVSTVTGVNRIAAGGNSTYAVKSDGSVWAWGAAPGSQQPVQGQPPPVQVPGLANIREIATSGDFSLAVAVDGTVWAWIGQEFATVQQISGLKNVLAVAVGSNVFAALDYNGVVWAWAATATDAALVFRATPVALTGLPVGVTAIAAKNQTILALSNGMVSSTTHNNSGSWSSPVMVPGIAGVQSISGSPADTAVAVLGDGSVWSLGTQTLAGGPPSPTALPMLNTSSTAKRYTVTPSIGPGGNLIPNAPQSTSANQTASFMVVPASGYVVAGVTGCVGRLTGASPNVYTTSPVSADCTVTATFTKDASGVPGAPTINSVIPGDGRATISFTAPANSGSAAIASYFASSAPGGNTGSCAAPCSSITVTGLTDGVPYVFTVSAINATGSGAASAASPSVTPQTIAVNFLPGWNLVGNGVEAPIDVPSTFNDKSRVTTIWKWVTSGTAQGVTYPAWAFYSPIQNDGGQAYAKSKGYDYLSVINAGEGFWVNAASAFSVTLPAGAAVQSSSFMPALASPATAGGTHGLPHNWSLIATGDSPKPADFDAAITRNLVPLPSGSVYASLTTLWAWDAGQQNWYFWAPSLVNSSGLANYIANKKYLDFGAMPTTPTGTLSPTTGFWVNMP